MAFNYSNFAGGADKAAKSNASKGTKFTEGDYTGLVSKVEDATSQKGNQMFVVSIKVIKAEDDALIGKTAKMRYHQHVGWSMDNLALLMRTGGCDMASIKSRGSMLDALDQLEGSKLGFYLKPQDDAKYYNVYPKVWIKNSKGEKAGIEDADEESGEVEEEVETPVETESEEKGDAGSEEEDGW